MSLSPAQVAYYEARINDDRRPVIYGVCSMLTALSTIAVVLRIIARRIKRLSLAADDYLALLALLLFFALVAETFVVTRYGIGLRLLALTGSDNIEIAKGFLAFKINYPLVTFTIKLSILLLYRRLFTTNIRSFRIGWWLNLFFAFGYTLSIITVIFTECKNVSQLWDLSPPPGACRTVSPVSLYTFAVLNGVSDICILSLPIPIIWSLQMPRKQKIATCGIFMFGFLVVVISFVRIYSLETGSGGTADPTYDQVDGLIWTVAEPAVGLICACLPVLRPLFTKAARNKRSSKSTQKPWLERKEWQEIHRDDTTAVNDSQPGGGGTLLHAAWSGSQGTEVSYTMNEMGAVEEGRK